MIEYIGIENFRNHNQIAFNNLTNIVCFLGKNGVGKTNILEAISIIDGSKGLRQAKTKDMKNTNHKQDFKICIDVDGNRILLESQGERKKFILNGTPTKTFYEVSQIINTIWSTPELEYLFSSSQQTRRDFFDKLTFCFHENHYSLLSSAKDLLSQRLRILVDNIHDGDKVIDEIELQLASIILQIIANRINALNLINACFIKTSGNIENFEIKLQIKHLDVYNLNNDEQVKAIKNILLQRRKTDQILKQSTFSHNKVDIMIKFADDANFANLSSGQIKFVLITICFAFAKALKLKFKDRIIVLLLDDFLSKLDYKNSQLLLEKLESWQYGQIFITTTSGFAAKSDNDKYTIINL